jgi:hypothetical protein
MGLWQQIKAEIHGSNVVKQLLDEAKAEVSDPTVQANIDNLYARIVGMVPIPPTIDGMLLSQDAKNILNAGLVDVVTWLDNQANPTPAG